MLSSKAERKQVPKEYMEYLVMREMHWTYGELRATPWDVVSDVWRYMNTERLFQTK